MVRLGGLSSLIYTPLSYGHEMPMSRMRVFQSIVLTALIISAIAAAASRLWAQLGVPGAPQAADEGTGMAERRRQWYTEQRAFPFDTIPEGALERAWAERVAAQASRLQSQPLASGFPWRPLGPAPDGLTPRQLTGRVRAIAAHPLDSSIIYAGSASGGVWKTTDDGASWRPITDYQCSLNTGAIAIDPVNPRVVYVGTGEHRLTNGCGVLRSTDDGETWTPLGSTTIGTSGISRILIDRATAGAPDRTTIYLSNNSGMFRSPDGGRTFQRLGLPTGGELLMDPRDSNILYAAVQQSTSTGFLSKSTDGGTTWTTLAGGLPGTFRYSTMAIDHRDSANVYAALADTNSLIGLYRSRDGGQSWSELGYAGSVPVCRGSSRAIEVPCVQCWFNLVLALDPNQPGTIYYGERFLYRSTDDGATWLDVRLGADPCTYRAYAFGDHHAIEFDRNGRLLNGHDGGINRSTDHGSTWDSLNTNLSLRQFYPGVSVHPTDPSVIFAGAQDLAVLRFTEGVWQNVYSGDGGFSAVDPTAPTTVYVEHQWGTGSGSGLARSDRSGDSGTFIVKQSGINLSDRAGFIPPLVIDPTTTNRLAFATYRVYLTDDRAEHWRVISPDLTGGVGYISRLAFAPSGGATLWAGTSGGRVWCTDDSGATWNDVSAGLPTRAITDIAVAPDQARTAYVTVSGFGVPHLWKTTNGGSSWQATSSGLPDVPANAVLIDRVPGTLFAGTDVGVYRTLNDGSTWDLFSDDLPNVPVTELVQNSRLGLLVAATYGRGLFVIGGLCSSAIDPSVATVDAAGGTVQVAVAAPCAWFVNLNSTFFPWVKVATRTSSGSNGSITLTVDPNPSADLRVAQLNIAASVLVIRQKSR